MTTLRTDSTHSGITIDYANGSEFVHGGSGLLSVYSDDEKAAINALTGTDDDTYYMFLVNSVTKLDADGNRTIVSGYMPIGYQHGFIFEQFNVVRTYAHELSHGAFALHHTFSANTESFRADEGTTNNLMDYTRDGIALNHRQWTWMHEKHGAGLFGFLADEESGELRELTSIVWIGDKLEGYFYDEIEKSAEADLPNFDKMYESYNNLMAKAKDEHLVFGLNKYYNVVCSSPTFFVDDGHTFRIGNKYYDKNQKLKKIFDNFSNGKNIDFKGVFLSDRNIYFEEYNLENIEYKLALYVGNELSLSNEMYVVNSFSELSDSKNVKVGYTSKYGLIVLFKQNAPYLTIQIMGGEPKESAIKWANYLSLICKSEEESNVDKDILGDIQIHDKDKLAEIWGQYFKTDNFIELMQKDVLTPAEIKECREYIKTLSDEGEKAKWYLKLQEKVPYHNQRNNTTQDRKVSENKDVYIGDVMCNVTSMAMALEMLGLENPCAPDIEQFEDCIESKITYESTGTFKNKPLNDGYLYDNARESKVGRESALNNMYGKNKIELDSKEFVVKENIDDIKKCLIERLSQGDGVIVSFGGHFIRVISCNDDGYIYDDPYGNYSIDTSSESKTNRKWNDSNSINEEKGVGISNVRKWTDFDGLVGKRFYIEYYHEN